MINKETGKTKPDNYGKADLVCTRCGTGGLAWKLTHRRYRLYYNDYKLNHGTQHYCLDASLPPPKPVVFNNEKVDKQFGEYTGNRRIFNAKVLQTKLCKEMEAMQMRDNVNLVDESGRNIKAGDKILYCKYSPSGVPVLEPIRHKGRFVLFNQERDEVIIKDSITRLINVIPLRLMYARTAVWYCRIYPNAKGEPSLAKSEKIEQVNFNYAPNGKEWLSDVFSYNITA